MRKVIHVIPTLENGGAETVLARLIEEFKKRGISQKVIVIKGSSEDFYYQKIKTLCEVYLWKTDRRKLIQNIKSQDLIPTISWMYGGIYFSYQLKFYFSLPLEIIWNIRSSNFKQPFRISQKLSLCAFGILSRIIQPKIIYCANAALITHRKYLFSKKKEITITNRLAKKEIDTPKSEADFNLPDKFLLFVGRYDPIKGPDRLFEILNNTIKKFPKIVLVIAGVGWSKKLLPNSVIDNIIILGNVKNVNLLYRKAACYLFTSYYEGFPNVLVEAICQGCPVVAYKAGDSKLILENYEYGDLVYSKTEFVNCLVKQIQKPISESRRQKISSIQKGIFQFEKTVDEYEKFIFNT